MGIWSVAKEFIALFELTTSHTSFPSFTDFSYTSNTIALLGNNYCFQIIETGFTEQF
jgi:hypothetical protein